MFASVTLPVTAQRWVLSGPAGPHLDTLAAGLIGAGVEVEPITPTTHYRLTGPAEMLEVLAGELRPAEGFDLQRETPPVGAIDMRTTLAPSHPFRRSVTVHGIGGAASFIARAVDRRLTVATIGADRWSVSGRTAALVEWMTAIYAKPADEVLALFGWTAESVAAEDSPTPTVNVTLPTPTINVTLPDRRTTSEIARNAAGDIRQIIQLETSV